MKALQNIEDNFARNQLMTLLKSGTTIYTQCNVSQSGMTRYISLFVVSSGKIVNISWAASKAIGYRLTKDHALIVSGCGMDMGFSVVYELGEARFPHGTKKAHGSRNGEPDFSGGYALNQEWL